MSEHPELLRRLRSGYHNADLVTVGGVTHDGRCLVAADAITAQAAEIERLRRDSDRHNAEWHDKVNENAVNYHHRLAAEAERDALRDAQTAAEAEREAERDALREALADVIMNAVLFPDDPHLELVDRALLDRVRDLIGLADLAASAQRARAALEPKP